jgi:predicted amidophosphoribosyltransferase
MPDEPRSVEPPRGFPGCRECYWLEAGSSDVCYPCASRTLALPTGHTCDVCAQSLDSPDSSCRNKLCHDAGRSIDRVYAIAFYTGDLEDKIKRLKFANRWGWAIIFGRILVGWLDQHWAEIGPFDEIVPNPTVATRQPIRHTEAVIAAATREDVFNMYPFRLDPPRLTKIRETTSSAGGDYPAKLAAADELLDAVIVDGDGLEGRRVLVVDDVATTCLQLDRIARLLKAAGAARVDAVVLARRRWA